MQVPAPFEYERATSVDHAIGLLERLGSEARLIAGGHSLLPMMRLRLANPEYIIDINDLVDELGEIRVEGDYLYIGAMARHQQLLESDVLAEHFPMFRDAEKVIADPVVRNRGTIGGSLAQADPAEDLSAVCSVLQADTIIKGSGGERIVPMHDFHRGPYETAIGDAEILTGVRIAIKANGSSAYHKVERRAGDWAVAAAGAAVWMDGDTISEGQVGLVAVGPNTTTVDAARDLLQGATPSEELFAQVGAVSAAACDPDTDMRGSAEYKRHLANELTQRSLRTAVARAQGQEV